MTFKPDKNQLLALETWYPSDHPLYLDPLHPALGLAGEAGEILDQWKKHIFKDGYKVSRDDFLDELGDLWYYLRILSFQNNIYLLIDEPKIPIYKEAIYLSFINYFSACVLGDVVLKKSIELQQLEAIATWLVARLNQLNCTLGELTALNYEKLRYGDNHGWKRTQENH